MAGSKATGVKAAATMKALYGEDFFRNIGARGGRAGMGPDYEGGFASPKTHFCKVLAGEHKISQCAGVKGGRVKKSERRQYE